MARPEHLTSTEAGIVLARLTAAYLLLARWAGRPDRADAAAELRAAIATTSQEG